MACDKYIPPEIMELHNDMVDKLDNEIFGKEFHRLKFLFSGIPLSPTELDAIKDIITLVRCLMKYETITYGNYTKLTKRLEKVNKRMVTVVNEYATKMSSVIYQRSGASDVYPETGSSVIYQRSGASDVYPETELPNEHKRIKQKAGVQCFNDPSRPANTEQTRACFQLSHEVTAQDTDSTGFGTERDWQFHLDWISEKIPNEIDGVATLLGIASDKQTLIKNDHNTKHEQCFHVLWEWYRSRESKVDNIEVLYEALTSMGRTDITESDKPKPSSFQNQIHNIPLPIERLSEKDLLNVSKEIGAQYPSLARYFGIKEGEIHASKHDKDGIQAQARDILQKCFKQKLLFTRNQLCDGLNYTNRRDIVDKLISGWS
ncbi:uncharacterized protein [Argopecten irradians]|uniref:uncharacterized protein n=1 Tax=Argopecten irradians TaxID=31199 RepID=UPI00372193F8